MPITVSTGRRNVGPEEAFAARREMRQQAANEKEREFRRKATVADYLESVRKANITAAQNQQHINQQVNDSAWRQELGFAELGDSRQQNAFNNTLNTRQVNLNEDVQRQLAGWRAKQAEMAQAKHDHDLKMAEKRAELQLKGIEGKIDLEKLKRGGRGIEDVSKRLWAARASASEIQLDEKDPRVPVLFQFQGEAEKLQSQIDSGEISEQEYTARANALISKAQQAQLGAKLPGELEIIDKEGHKFYRAPNGNVYPLRQEEGGKSAEKEAWERYGGGEGGPTPAAPPQQAAPPQMAPPPVMAPQPEPDPMAIASQKISEYQKQSGRLKQSGQIILGRFAEGLQNIASSVAPDKLKRAAAADLLKKLEAAKIESQIIPHGGKPGDIVSGQDGVMREVQADGRQLEIGYVNEQAAQNAFARSTVKTPSGHIYARDAKGQWQNVFEPKTDMQEVELDRQVRTEEFRAAMAQKQLELKGKLATTQMDIQSQQQQLMLDKQRAALELEQAQANAQLASEDIARQREAASAKHDANMQGVASKKAKMDLDNEAKGVSLPGQGVDVAKEWYKVPEIAKQVPNAQFAKPGEKPVEGRVYRNAVGKYGVFKNGQLIELDFGTAPYGLGATKTTYGTDRFPDTAASF